MGREPVEESIPIYQVCRKELGDMHNIGYDLVKVTTSFSTLKRTTYGHISVARGNLKEQKRAMNLFWNFNKCLKINEGSSLLQTPVLGMSNRPICNITKESVFDRLYGNISADLTNTLSLLQTDNIKSELITNKVRISQ